jgi:hypothetical protein
VVTDLPQPGEFFFVASGSSLVVAGFYNPATHTLVATDWVHDELSAAARLRRSSSTVEHPVRSARACCFQRAPYYGMWLDYWRGDSV